MDEETEILWSLITEISKRDNETISAKEMIQQGIFQHDCDTFKIGYKCDAISTESIDDILLR